MIIGYMSSSSTAFLVCASAYAGFQWTVHLLIYPQFAAVPPSTFPAFERGHQRRISFVVGPLFAAIVLSAVWVVVDRPAGVWPGVLAAGLVTVILGVTAFLAVPLHRRLSGGWDPVAYRALLRADLVRTVAATALLGVGVFVAVAPAG